MRTEISNNIVDFIRLKGRATAKELRFFLLKILSKYDKIVI